MIKVFETKEEWYEDCYNKWKDTLDDIESTLLDFKESGIGNTHFGLGMWIRNEFIHPFHDDNRPHSVHPAHPDIDMFFPDSESDKMIDYWYEVLLPRDLEQ
jgi:hypothetical protein